MSSAKPYLNTEPAGDAPLGAPREAIRREFAKRLYAAMMERGWNQSELARAAARHMEDGKFGRDNVSNYIRGNSLPGPVHLNALARALDMKPEELLPARSFPSVDDKAPPLDVKDLGEGKAWLHVNMSAPWPVALQVLQLLKGSEGSDHE